MNHPHRHYTSKRRHLWTKPPTLTDYIAFLSFSLLTVLLATAIWTMQDYPDFPDLTPHQPNQPTPSSPAAPYELELASLHRPDGRLPVTFSPSCTTLATPPELAFAHFPDIGRVLSTDLLQHTRHYMMAISNASYDSTRSTCRHMRLRWHSDKNPSACKSYAEAALRAFETCCMVLGQYQYTYRMAELGWHDVTDVEGMEGWEEAVEAARWPMQRRAWLGRRELEGWLQDEWEIWWDVMELGLGNWKEVNVVSLDVGSRAGL